MEIATDTDCYTAEERALLEARWETAGRALDDARRHVEFGVGVLNRIVLVADQHAVIEAIVGRWVSEALFELRCLDVEGQLPREGRR
jgi:hypothetical protein